MRFEATPLAGAVEIHVDPHQDERGFFARTWCAREFAGHGLSANMVQASMSHNRRKGTVRGMHFQWPPSKEGKLVRCERGAVHDVIIDLRPESASFLAHFATVLDASRSNGLYVPPGCAHGFQTLEDEVRVGYLMTDVYAPDLSDGVRWDDVAFGIRWPLPVSVISDRDRGYADFDPQRHADRYERAVGGALP